LEVAALVVLLAAKARMVQHLQLLETHQPQLTQAQLAVVAALAVLEQISLDCQVHLLEVKVQPPLEVAEEVAEVDSKHLLQIEHLVI
jgi:hypothetical protein